MAQFIKNITAIEQWWNNNNIILMLFLLWHEYWTSTPFMLISKQVTSNKLYWKDMNTNKIKEHYRDVPQLLLR